jgi:bifunctional UDP-N-acetylglucosamine pyrophosphorylase/glucosamine-1-phosphate N-acetyltransferase
LVFSLDRFPCMNEAGASELRRWLLDRGRSARGAFAPSQQPFFAVSPSFLRKKGLALKPGVFRALRSSTLVEELELRNPIAAVDAQREPLRVEAAVLALQLRHLQKSGVIVEDFAHFFMEGLPPVGRGSVFGSGIVIKGDCRIGRNVALFPNCYIENSRIGDHCVLLPGTVVFDSQVENNVQLGPYCHVRLNSLVRQGAKIGNFVEMKKSAFGRGSKAMHLSYIGDATVGRQVNIGAGTITCNYDGKNKNPTFIGDKVFIGSGTELVAPVTVHSDSYVAAGSTITEDVPRHALAVARQRQHNITGWVLRRKAKKN